MAKKLAVESQLLMEGLHCSFIFVMRVIKNGHLTASL